MDQIAQAAEWIRESNNIVVLTGAGVSTESGIPDFRSAGGIFNSSRGAFAYPPEVMLSHSFFMEHRDVFFEYYRTKLIFKDIRPNPAHYSMARLEAAGRLKAVVTQNIDGLHQLAGSKNVFELHGSISRNYCMDCQEKYDLDYVIYSPEIVPKCEKCGGVVRPDVVLYEEQLDMELFEQAISFIANAEVLIVGGTSLVVYPAAGLVDYYNGKKLILINKSETAYDGKADLVIHESIGKVFEAIA